MRYLKTFESYNTLDEYVSSVKDLLKVYNIRPVELNQIVNSYIVEIENNYNKGTFPQEIVNVIKSDLDLDSGGYFSIAKVKGPSSNYHSHSTN